MSDGHVIWVLAALYVLGAFLAIATFFRIIRLISSAPDHEDPGNGGGGDGCRARRPSAPRWPWGDGPPSIAFQPPQARAPRRARSHRAQTRMRPRPCPPCLYVKNYCPDVNLFVDHSQSVQLECLRAGIRGTKSLWGRGDRQ